MQRCAGCRRAFATAASAPAQAKRTRIAAAALLSRPPLQLPLESDFKKAYYAYSKRIRKSLADEFDSEWYFRKGSQAERAFLAQEADIDRGRIDRSDIPSNPKDGDLRSLNRRYDRTLFLLLKKKRQTGQKGAWQFPQGTVEESDASLKDAALRELTEEAGPDMDLFAPSKVPASVYTYDLPLSSALAKDFDETKVFLVPFRILRGQAQITPQGKKEQIEDFAWLTKEEVEERVDSEYWASALKDGHLLGH